MVGNQLADEDQVVDGDGAVAVAEGARAPLWLLVPQAVVAIALYPAVGRVVAWLDRVRLRRFRVFA